MKRQILISALILLSVAGFARAVDLPDLRYYNLSEDDFTAYKQGELLVRFAEVDAGGQLPEGLLKPMGPLTSKAVRNSISNYIFTGAVVDREYDEIAPGLAVVELPEGMSVADACIQFNQSASVLYAEPNYKYKLLAVPNDPMFSDLWGMNNTGQTGGTEDADVDAPEAWDIQTGNPNIIIAVTDTGIDYAHPDLADNMWVNSEEMRGSPDVDDDGNGYVDDIYGYDFAGAVARDPDDEDSDPIDNHFHGTSR
jgi:subtilisin family serine protease